MLRNLLLFLSVSVRMAAVNGYGYRYGYGYGYEGSGYSYPESRDTDYSVQYTGSAYHVDYREPRWCNHLRVEDGYVDCRSPRGPNYRSTLGTRCAILCDRGYRLLGRGHVQCLVSRRWSGFSRCKQVRCHMLPAFPYGTYICSKGSAMDSRCEYICEQGYQLEGDRTRVCLQTGQWSGTEPFCVDHEPPRIKCPGSRVKVAEPGKMMTRVYWDPPRIKDPADKHSIKLILKGLRSGSEFTEGEHLIRYVAYDRERNKASCKFTIRVHVKRCPTLKPLLHGYITCTSDGNNYGATCSYLCDGGYERQGVPKRVCLFNRSWSGVRPSCVSIQINTEVTSATALLDQFYEKQRLLIISSPSPSDVYYRLQINMLQQATCGLDLRHIILIELVGSPPRVVGRLNDQELSSDVIDQLRQVHYLSSMYFNMVLIDKYGIDRERYIQPASSGELFSFVDEYLLHKEERALQQQKTEQCD
ncbi:sushi repeat-containing protein SRPX2 [Callorhinchus milii]|uniref:sushi repeat-containing protein SRPX2 n=1 Tax=Callorhinchus milii TaxID=7868 RepID=UPI001C3F6C4F|nr:sushi repeat-containing protein SRPX2 [Callorhinchus milii]